MKSQIHLSVLAAAACLNVAASVGAEVTPHAGMLRYPDVGKDKIVFVYANDLWLVDRDGGQAVPLASPPGAEGFPRFSPDDQTIAFMGNYDGGQDLYTISVDGGIPFRVTHHPAGENLSDWTPDGELLFYTVGLGDHPRTTMMHKVDAEGGLPEDMPVPFGSFGSISDDGQWLAYTPASREFATWKRYRGGWASDIWLFNLKTHESRQITDWEGTDCLPMWQGRKVYYLSDNGPEEKLNIWSYDTKNGRRSQVTRFDDYDVKWPSIGPGKRGHGEIVFQKGTGLFVLDLRTGGVDEVKVTIPGARPTIRKQRVDAAQFIFDGNISPTGKRACAEARGDIWTVPAEKGSPRNLTRTSGVAERAPAWSPDGKWIAYFSDESGEYELYMTQSDGKGETRQLTSGNKTYFMGMFWSPDSEKIALIDKDGKLFIHTIESGETKMVDQDPRGRMGSINWSHDSQWITYARSSDETVFPLIWLYNVDNDEHHQLTSGMFPDSSPVFDRKGEYLYFTSNRHFTPTYEDFGSTWIYKDSGVLIAVPLKADHDDPWQLESDEETWEEDEADDAAAAAGDAADEAGAGEADEEGDDAAEADDGKAAPTAGDDGDEDADDEPAHPLEGVWEGSLSGLKALLEPMMSSPDIPAEIRDAIVDTVSYRLDIVVDEDGNISGTSTVELPAMLGGSQTEELGDVTFNEDTGEYMEVSDEEGNHSVMRGVLEGGTITGTWEVTGMMNGSGTWSVTKTGEEAEEPEDDAAEVVEIDLEGFENRAILLPVGSGDYRNLGVNDKGQLLYVKGSEGIKLFDITDDDPGEKTVAAGAQGFIISADGKKILYADPGGMKIGNASSGAAGKPIPTRGMIAHINPREEWAQVFRDAWRIQRDFFYVENMHGLDWNAIYDQYEAMLADCVTRDDVTYVIREMISELNVGHAYYFGGPADRGPRGDVGLLGVDFELDETGYRVSKIYEGAPWDVDARGPLTQKGCDIKEGEYILAVNGVPVDTDLDPWAAFVDTSGRSITLTVLGEPVEDDDEEADAGDDADDDQVDVDADDEEDDDGCELEERDVIVEPIRSDRALRYRAWVEANRKYVEEQTDGQVGYIYVPDTGINGQNDLVRQFVGQFGKKALIVDERWNGGGQLPNRFIELLNRPVTNYFAIRDGKDWKIPQVSHTGPKCMLINGQAGSGGDMFPWLFRDAGLGPLIGTRTWGGLVGISGNPPLIDGGYTSVPRFAFFERDGTWGVEGHGVDPDIEVIADPALMVDGGDPQLDKAIEVMLEEIKRDPYIPPTKPEAPDRTGIGIREEDK